MLKFRAVSVASTSPTFDAGGGPLCPSVATILTLAIERLCWSSGNDCCLTSSYRAALRTCCARPPCRTFQARSSYCRYSVRSVSERRALRTPFNRTVRRSSISSSPILPRWHCVLLSQTCLSVVFTIVGVSRCLEQRRRLEKSTQIAHLH